MASVSTAPRDIQQMRTEVTNILKVLDLKQYYSLNTNPRWLTSLSWVDPDSREPFTVKKFLLGAWAASSALSGEERERYALNAVIQCAQGSAGRKLALELGTLAMIWLEYGILPFVSDRTKRSTPVDDIPGYVVPTMEETARILQAPGRTRLKRTRPPAFRLEGRERDGRYCKATGQNGGSLRGLEVAHIFKRAVAVHCQSNDPLQSRSAIATMDILRHLCGLDTDFILHLHRFDTLQNGITLALAYHQRFGDLSFGLRLIHGEQNAYRVVDHNPPVNQLASYLGKGMKITFEDESEDGNYDMPNSGLFRVHATLGHIFFASGAADTFGYREMPGQRPVDRQPRPWLFQAFWMGVLLRLWNLWERVAAVIFPTL